MNAIVVFDSKHGATADIASRIVEKLGDGVSLVYLRDKGAARVALDDCDLVVLGGPIYAGTWSRRAAAFARGRERELAGKAFAFFSVGMNVEDGIAEAAAALPKPLAEAAVASAKLGGEIRWGRMNFLERLVIRIITGTSGDETRADAAAINAFAAEAATALKQRGAG